MFVYVRRDSFCRFVCTRVGLCALEKVCVRSSRLVYVDKCVLPTVLGKNLSELLNPKQRETRGAYLLELNVGHFKILN